MTRFVNVRLNKLLLNIFEFHRRVLQRAIHKCFWLGDGLIWVFLLFLELFLHMVARLGHLRILIDCVIIGIKFGLVESFGAIKTAEKGTIFSKELLLVNLDCRDCEGRVRGCRFFVLFRLLSVCDIAEETSCNWSLSCFILLHH